VLYDPKWTKSDDNCDVTARGFLAWLEAQDPDERYFYAYKTVCAVGQWLTATDHPILMRADWHSYPVICDLDRAAGKRPHSFGALAKRLRALTEIPF
jgi:hypothetical protein